MIESFIIVNDGSPVNIQLSHGSDGSTEGSGQCRVTINGVSYNLLSSMNACLTES